MQADVRPYQLHLTGGSDQGHTLPSATDAVVKRRASRGKLRPSETPRSLVDRSDPESGPGASGCAEPSRRAKQLAPILVGIRARNGLFLPKKPFLARSPTNIGRTRIETSRVRATDFGTVSTNIDRCCP